MHETVELDPNALVISKEIFTANFSYGINAINGNGNINGDIFIESFGALFLLGEVYYSLKINIKLHEY